MALPRCKDSRPTPLTGPLRASHRAAVHGLDRHFSLSGTGDRLRLFQLPPICPEKHAFSEQVFFVHSPIGIAIDCLAATHIGAALYHHSVRKNRVLMRMLTANGRTYELTPSRAFTTYFNTYP